MGHLVNFRLEPPPISILKQVSPEHHAGHITGFTIIDVEHGESLAELLFGAKLPVCLPVSVVDFTLPKIRKYGNGYYWL